MNLSFQTTSPGYSGSIGRSFANPIKYDEAIRIILSMLVIEEDEEGEGHHRVTELDFLSVFISIQFFGVLEPLNVMSPINIT